MPAHNQHIRVDHIARSYADRTVFDDLSFVVDGCDRLGLIGENGVGKSTLLRLMAGVEQPDGGTVSRPARTGLLWQEVRSIPGQTVGQLVEAALAEVRAIEAELEAAASGLSSGDDGGRYERALAAAERADVWSTDARVATVLAGLGVDDIPGDRELARVSGGQRARLALAALLFERPDALLLDEPTNHLDDSAVAFLRGQLVAWRGPVVFASHDRAFLDEVATALLDIDPSRTGATRYGGGYSDYLAAKAAERARWEQQFAREQDELGKLRQSVDVTARTINTGNGPRDNDKFLYSFKAGNIDRQVSRRVRNAQGRLDELTAAQVDRPTPVLSFAGIPHGSHPLEDTESIVEVTDARLGSRLDVSSFGLAARDRLLVTGPNGAGKSTLLSVIAGHQRLDSGVVRRRSGLRVALLEQDVRFNDPARSARAIYGSAVGERRAESVPLSSLGLLFARDLDRPVGALSVGQQRRLALALIIARPPHLFLLDEPTNHLSLGLATELEDALGAYPGAVVVASHDRWLRQRWSGLEAAIVNGRVA